MARGNAFTKSQNPVLSEELFQKQGRAVAGEGGKTFTISSAINKTFMLMTLLILTSVVSYMFPSPILTWGGAIGGLIIVILAVRKIERSAMWAPMYALMEGFFVGGVSALYATLGDGIILQAVSLTLLVFFVMLVIFKTRIIPVTNKLRTGIVMATGAVFLLYLVTFILSLFSVNVPYIHEGGTFGILISVVILGIAALNLLLDFDLFEKGEQTKAPEYMEWFAGMSLLITIVWIYIEVLRLVSKMRE
jgi:uncharacterized YccA/Bax inhibitor family protein